MMGVLLGGKVPSEEDEQKVDRVQARFEHKTIHIPTVTTTTQFTYESLFDSALGADNVIVVTDGTRKGDENEIKRLSESATYHDVLTEKAADYATFMTPKEALIRAGEETNYLFLDEFRKEASSVILKLDG